VREVVVVRQQRAAMSNCGGRDVAVDSRSRDAFFRASAMQRGRREVVFTRELNKGKGLELLCDTRDVTFVAKALKQLLDDHAEQDDASVQ
jgi:hypothetical protein